MIFPSSRLEPLVTITPFSHESLMGAALACSTNMSLTTSATWPIANMAYFIPFVISKPITVQQLIVMNGATATGNIDMGIYTSDFTRIVSSGSQAQTGVNTPQSCPITATRLGAGWYYMAIAMSSTSSTVFRVNMFSSAYTRSIGCAQMASALPLPATATPSAFGTAAMPLIALSTRSVI